MKCERQCLTSISDSPVKPIVLIIIIITIIMVLNIIIIFIIIIIIIIIIFIMVLNIIVQINIESGSISQHTTTCPNFAVIHLTILTPTKTNQYQPKPTNNNQYQSKPTNTNHADLCHYNYNFNPMSPSLASQEKTTYSKGKFENQFSFRLSLTITRFHHFWDFSQCLGSNSPPTWISHFVLFHFQPIFMGASLSS